MVWRKKIYHLLESDETHAGRLVNLAIVLLIVVSVFAIVFESDPDFFNQWNPVFRAVELVSLAVFTVEYLVRVWVCVENKMYRGSFGRLRYMISPMALIDLIAILPVYLFLFGISDDRYLFILRLLRVVKLTRHFYGLNMLVAVLHRELPSLLSALCILLVLVILASGGIHLAEQHVQPEKFGSVLKSMWWSIVTLTTIGYGDVVPVTTMGRFFGSIVALLGVGLAALPAGIIAAGFNSELQRRRERYQLQLRRALEDGAVTAEERAHLLYLRKKLGLGTEDIDQALIDEALHSIEDHHRCPHCGKPVDR